MLSLLFMCVEILPVLMKLLLNFSPPSTYDRLAALRDSADLDVEGLQQQARRTVEQAQNELLVLAEKERVDRQKDAVLARRRLRIAQQIVVPSSPEVRRRPGRRTPRTPAGSCGTPGRCGWPGARPGGRSGRSVVRPSGRRSTLYSRLVVPSSSAPPK